MHNFLFWSIVTIQKAFRGFLFGNLHENKVCLCVSNKMQALNMYKM